MLCDRGRGGYPTPRSCFFRLRLMIRDSSVNKTPRREFHSDPEILLCLLCFWNARTTCIDLFIHKYYTLGKHELKRAMWHSLWGPLWPFTRMLFNGSCGRSGAIEGEVGGGWYKRGESAWGQILQFVSSQPRYGHSSWSDMAWKPRCSRLLLLLLKWRKLKRRSSRSTLMSNKQCFLETFETNDDSSKFVFRLGAKIWRFIYFGFEWTFHHGPIKRGNVERLGEFQGITCSTPLRSNGLQTGFKLSFLLSDLQRFNDFLAWV